VAERDEAVAGGAKSASAVGTINMLPHDDEAIAQLVAPVVSRIDRGAPTLQALVVTADADVALTFARAAITAGETPIVPATSEGRTLRLLRAGGVAAIAGPPGVLVSLLRQSALKLDGIRIVVLAWADEILATEQGEALETLMAEIPKDVARMLVTAEMVPAIEELAERYFRRAHRLSAPPVPEGLGPVVISYVSVTETNRRAALRRILDEIDPPSAAIVARTDGGAAEARQVVRELGYGADDPNVVVTAGEPNPDVSLIVLYELPTSAAQLRAMVGAGTPRVVALTRPRDLARLGALAGLTPTPLPSREATDRARRAEVTAREELRAELRRGRPDRQIMAIEPLLDEFDGVELAGAALRMLERARERAAVAAASASAAAPTAQAAAFTRLFMTVGSRDNVGPGDLVGMITAEGGITSAQIGKIDIRDNHSLVEIAAPVAEKVAATISGSAVKGRRIVARLERSREERTSRDDPKPRGRDDRPPRSRDDRPPRGRDDRPRGGFDRPRPRPGGDREGRPPGRGPSERGPRDTGSEGRAARGAIPPRRDE
jgi:ATP-dependent RNA helicase DeaD